MDILPPYLLPLSGLPPSASTWAYLSAGVRGRNEHSRFCYGHLLFIGADVANKPVRSQAGRVWRHSCWHIAATYSSALVPLLPWLYTDQTQQALT